MTLKSALAATAAVSIISATAGFAGPEAEVLHWWTSGGEAKSVAVLQEEFASKGGTWTDMPVAGGGGAGAVGGSGSFATVPPTRAAPRAGRRDAGST